MAGYEAWLDPAVAVEETQAIGRVVYVDDAGEHVLFSGEMPRAPLSERLLVTALDELERMIGLDAESALTLRLELKPSELSEEGYRLRLAEGLVTLEASGVRGLFYGVQGYLRLLRSGALKPGLDLREEPAFGIRMINHWDNMDGSIERGYSGRSFFFRDGEILGLERIEDYARMLASLGINYVAINNVNVDRAASFLITDKHYAELRRVFGVLTAYGVRPALSINYASPMELGGLETADPLDPCVIAWWEAKAQELRRELPELGAVVIKADSEGRPGPFTYGRTQAEGANVVARALAQHHPDCIVFWRAFVYNSQQDWRDYGTDRARAAHDYFAPLDGEFEPNVQLQIKNGPMDFQVREPVSPLFSTMEQTALTLELQVAQEYTGHQIDLCYLAPMWREILDHRLEGPDLGPKLHESLDSITAVANTGDDPNWFGNDLAAANLYCYGRLAWDPELDGDAILDEWLSLTYALEPETQRTIRAMLSTSRETYELYTAPLGIGWMVKTHLHYGPGVNDYEYDRWGTYHRADREAIGVDRTAAGTGYAELYPKAWAEYYSSLASCPDELVLFFHRLSYTQILHSGTSVIQHIYDSRFEGYERVLAYQAEWANLEGKLPASSYANVSERLERQRQNAREWRDQVNSFFYRLSGIPDAHGRTIY